MSHARFAVDYILFLQKDVTYEAVPNEVQAVRWVDKAELKTMMATAGKTAACMGMWVCLRCLNKCDAACIAVTHPLPAEAQGLKITPWFKLIVEK